MSTTLAEMIKPDWTVVWDQKEAETEMPGFQFLGPGWYFRDGTTMLVMPADKEGDFLFWVYFNRDPRTAFTVFPMLPVRMEAPSADRDSAHNRTVNRVVFLLTLLVLFGSVIIGARFGLLWQLPFLVVLWMLNTYVRNLFLRK